MDTEGGLQYTIGVNTLSIKFGISYPENYMYVSQMQCLLYN